jgi:hypothetical protein
LAQHASTSIGHHLAITAPSSMPPQAVVRQRRIALRCPACRARRTLTYSMLIGPSGWKQVWCPGTCQRPYSSHQWACACSRPWQNCATHAHGDFTPAKRQRACRTPRRVPACPTCPPCQRAAKPFQRFAQPPPIHPTATAASSNNPCATISEAPQHASKRAKVQHHNESAITPNRPGTSSSSSLSVAREGTNNPAQLPIGKASPSSPRSSSSSVALGSLSPTVSGGPAVDAQGAHPFPMRPTDAQGRAASSCLARLTDSTGSRPKRASSTRNSAAQPKMGKRARLADSLAAVTRLREAHASPL